MNFLSTVSKYRTEMMGFATIWIIIYHAHIGDLIPNPIIHYIIESAYMGVDMFIFLSGFGLCYSYLKPQTKLQFYKKRFSRIYPAYAIVTLLNAFLGTYIFKVYGPSLSDLMLQLLVLDYWFTKGAWFWYIPVIFTFYLAFPFFIKQYKKNPKLAMVFIFALSIILTILHFVRVGATFDYRILFTTRIPIFCMGVAFGQLALSGEFKKTYLKIIMYVTMVVGFVMSYIFSIKSPGFAEAYGLILIFDWLLIAGLVLLMSNIFSFFAKKISFVNIIPRFVGKISLELYLLHIVFFNYVYALMDILGIRLYAAYGVATIIAFISAYLLSKLTDFLYKKYIVKFL